MLASSNMEMESAVQYNYSPIMFFNIVVIDGTSQ